MEIWIGSLISAVVATVLATIISLYVNSRSSYVKIVVEKRLQSVEERRQLLKELVLNTDPTFISEHISANKEEILIEKLLDIKAGFHYRMVDLLYPESEILPELDMLIEDSISKINHEKVSRKSNRDRCIQLIKVYNFASWRFVQKQSTGRRTNSVRKFEKEYKRTLKDVIICRDLIENIKNENAEQKTRKSVKRCNNKKSRKFYKNIYELTQEMNDFEK